MNPPNTAVDLASIGAREIPEFVRARDIWPRGRRLDAVREAAAAFKTRLVAQGTVRAVRSVDTAAAPYTTAYAFHGAAIAPLTPMMRAAETLFAKYWIKPEEVLPSLGLSNEDVDFVTFDHQHVQDLRMLLGSTETIPGESAPRSPIFPRARLLAHRREIATFQSPHPMQWAWYVEGGIGGVDPERLALFDTDIDPVEDPRPARPRQALWPRGHPHANTLEDALDQYDSMVIEKTLADRSKTDPRWLQVLPSSELAGWTHQWPVHPTHFHGGINHGRITTTTTLP